MTEVLGSLDVLPEPEYRYDPEFIGLYDGPLSALFYRSLGLTNPQIADVLAIPPRKLGYYFARLSSAFRAGSPYATYRAYKRGVIPVAVERATPELGPISRRVLEYIGAGYPVAEIVEDTGLDVGAVNLALDTLHNDLEVPFPRPGTSSEDALVRGAFLAGIYRPDVV